MLDTPRLARRCALAATACAVALGTLAPAASAGTIRYTAAPSAQYSVDNDHGILKVTFNTCATAGSTQTVGFTLDTEITGKTSGTGTFKVLKSDGGSLSFDPPTLTLAPGSQQTQVTVTVSTPTPRPQGAFFRFKIDPQNGIGIGEGPGVMIHFGCVLSPGPGTVSAQQAEPCPTTATARREPNKNDGKDGKDGNPTDGDAGKGNDDRQTPAPQPEQTTAASSDAPQTCAPASVPASAPDPTPAPSFSEASLSAPTAGVFASLASRQARGPARCVATPRRLRVRKGETTQLVITIESNDVAIRSAAVRVLGAGVHRTARTNRDGQAVISVRPTRTGRLAVQSDVCFGVDRLRVLGAKDASSGVSPAFAG
jgi:hypothetical protein